MVTLRFAVPAILATAARGGVLFLFRYRYPTCTVRNQCAAVRGAIATGCVCFAKCLARGRRHNSISLQTRTS